MFNKKKKVGKVSKAVKKYVHKVVDAEPELKQWITSLPNHQPISNTVGDRDCFNIQGAVVGQQGVLDNQRLGDKIKVHGFTHKGTFQILAAQGQTIACKVRLIILVDKLTHGVLLPLIEVVTDTATNQAVNSPINQKYRHSHIILYDKTYDLNSPMYSATNNIPPAANNMYQGACTKSFSITHKFKRPLTMTFYTNNVTTNISSVEGPSIIAMFMAESGGVSVIDQISSLLFTDA